MREVFFLVYIGIVVYVLGKHNKEKNKEDLTIRLILCFVVSVLDVTISLVYIDFYDFVFCIGVYILSFLFIFCELIVLKNDIYKESKGYFDIIMYILVILNVCTFLVYFRKGMIIGGRRSGIYVPYTIGSILMIINMKSINNKLHTTEKKDIGEWFFGKQKKD